MTLTDSTAGPVRAWHDAFAPNDLQALRRGIPVGIHAAQVRTGRADTEYADPDGERDVYGVGMSKAAPKEIRSQLMTLSNYHEVTIPKTSRKLMFVGRGLIFPIRVGVKMRRNTDRLWLRSFSEARQQYFGENSTYRRSPEQVGLFDVSSLQTSTEDVSVGDALRHIETDDGRTELFVAYFSSSPRGVGQIMWAPARLDGRYLNFIEPEMLTYQKMASTKPAQSKPQAVNHFHDAPRPRTTVNRRPKPQRPSEQGQ